MKFIKHMGHYLLGDEAECSVYGSHTLCMVRILGDNAISRFVGVGSTGLPITEYRHCLIASRPLQRTTLPNVLSQDQQGAVHPLWNRNAVYRLRKFTLYYSIGVMI